MMKNKLKETHYVMIREDAVPEVYRKVLAVKRKLANEPQLSINQACKDFSISRSAFYKYRDSVHWYESEKKGFKISFQLWLELTPGLLSRIIDIVEKHAFELLNYSQYEEEKGLHVMILTCHCPEQKLFRSFREDILQLREVREFTSIPD